MTSFPLFIDRFYVWRWPRCLRCGLQLRSAQNRLGRCPCLRRIVRDVSDILPTSAVLTGIQCCCRPEQRAPKRFLDRQIYQYCYFTKFESLTRNFYCGPINIMTKLTTWMCKNPLNTRLSWAYIRNIWPNICKIFKLILPAVLWYFNEICSY